MCKRLTYQRPLPVVELEAHQPLPPPKKNNSNCNNNTINNNIFDRRLWTKKRQSKAKKKQINSNMYQSINHTSARCPWLSSRHTSSPPVRASTTFVGRVN